MRGATDTVDSMERILGISIHAPREGCDDTSEQNRDDGTRFQSTHPVRGATRYLKNEYDQLAFQSTHPVRGATS